MTQDELLYSYSAAGAAVSTATETNAFAAAQPACAIPAGYFVGGGSRSRALKVRAWGQATCGSTATNATWTARLLTAETWSAGGILLGSTAASAMAVSITASFWMLDLDVWVRTESTGAGTTIASMGLVQCPSGLSSPFAATIPATNTAFTVATLDAQTTYYLFLSGLVSQTTGAPSWTLQGLKVYGEN